MNLNRSLLAAVATCAALSAPLSALAGTITTYTTEAAFQAAVSNMGKDTFDDLTNGTQQTSPLSRTAGAFGYTATATGDLFVISGQPSGQWLSTAVSATSVTLGGFSNVFGVGGYFFSTDLNGDVQANDNVSIAGVDADGAFNIGPVGPTSASFFRGFVSTAAITSLTIASTTQNYVTLNDVVLGGEIVQTPPPGGGGPLPEPGTLPLVALAALASVVTLRRRKSA